MTKSVSYPNNALNASSTFLTGTNSIFSFFVSIPCKLYLGNETAAKLLGLSDTLFNSIHQDVSLPTWSISPAIQTSGSIAASIFEERMAQ